MTAIYVPSRRDDIHEVVLDELPELDVPALYASIASFIITETTVYRRDVLVVEPRKFSVNVRIWIVSTVDVRIVCHSGQAIVG